MFSTVLVSILLLTLLSPIMADNPDTQNGVGYAPDVEGQRYRTDYILGMLCKHEPMLYQRLLEPGCELRRWKCKTQQ
jgi:hypothetical protein